jgi:FAD:protein FMN transferase
LIRTAVLLAALFAPAAVGAEALTSISDGRYAMGTVLEVTLGARDAAAGRATLERLFAVAARLDALLSRFDPESALCRLNARAGQGPQRVDPDLARVLGEALAYGALTRGAFDVTVGPLVALWTEAARRGAPPVPNELAAALARVGPGVLRATPPDTAEILKRGSSVDLGAIAKGYALDRMVELLRAEGVESALLSFGQSSLRAVGTPPDGGRWRLLVRDPDGGFAGVAELRDVSLSVSASLGQSSEIGGRRYGHVIDPRTGEPLLRSAEAVVLCPSGSLAEALSTAWLVLGAEEGLAVVAAQPGCEGWFAESGGPRHATPGWRAATTFRENTGDERSDR